MGFDGNCKRCNKYDNLNLEDYCDECESKYECDRCSEYFEYDVGCFHKYKRGEKYHKETWFCKKCDEEFHNEIIERAKKR
jgi:hypothetical protein